MKRVLLLCCFYTLCLFKQCFWALVEANPCQAHCKSYYDADLRTGCIKAFSGGIAKQGTVGGKREKRKHFDIKTWDNLFYWLCYSLAWVGNRVY